jgi:hypothetical protein
MRMELIQNYVQCLAFVLGVLNFGIILGNFSYFGTCPLD